MVLTNLYKTNKDIMYKITDELNENGFSVNSVDLLIKRNNGSRAFNTLDYFVILIAVSEAVFTIQGIDYKVKKGSLTFLSPAKNIEFCPNCNGEGNVYALTFSASFFERSAKDTMLLYSNLFFNTALPFVTTQASIPIDEVLKLIINRLALYKTKQNNGLYISVAHNCVEALLLDGLFYVDENICEINDTRKFTFLDIVNRFRILLQQNYQTEKQVSFYADKLHITPRRLSEMTESVLGKSAKQVIIDKMVGEGSRMLKNSNKTISEIAYDLGFNDEANFSTFIKKHTNKNPRMIREEINTVLGN